MKFIAPILILFAVLFNPAVAQAPDPAPTSPDHWYVTITHDVENVPNPLVYQRKSAGFASENECKDFVLKGGPGTTFQDATLVVLEKLKDLGATEISIGCTKLDQPDTL